MCLLQNIFSWVVPIFGGTHKGNSEVKLRFYSLTHILTAVWTTDGITKTSTELLLCIVFQDNFEESFWKSLGWGAVHQHQCLFLSLFFFFFFGSVDTGICLRKQKVTCALNEIWDSALLPERLLQIFSAYADKIRVTEWFVVSDKERTCSFYSQRVSLGTLKIQGRAKQHECYGLHYMLWQDNICVTQSLLIPDSLGLIKENTHFLKVRRRNRSLVLKGQRLPHAASSSEI